MKNKLYTIAILLWSSLSLAHPQWEKFAYSEKWIRALHYWPIYNGYLSELEDLNFFIHPFGFHKPEEELLASLKAIKDNPKIADYNSVGLSATSPRYKNT